MQGIPRWARYTSGMSPSRSLDLASRCWRILPLLIVAAGCSLPSRTDMETAQALIEITDAFNDVRAGQAELQDRIDSLVTVVARQDTTIRTLANLAGVPVPSR